MTASNRLIVFSAPSGAGKTTLVKYILSKFNEIEFSISATSRKPRGNEKNGVDYYFLSDLEFKKRINNKEFVEHEEVYGGFFYGTLKSEVERIWGLGKHVIFDIDVSGGLRIKRKYPENTIAIFVKPPSIDELKIRLKKRKTETENKINMRISKASAEMATADLFDLVIENKILKSAQKEARNIVLDFIKS